MRPPPGWQWRPGALAGLRSPGSLLSARVSFPLLAITSHFPHFLIFKDSKQSQREVDPRAGNTGHWTLLQASPQEPTSLAWIPASRSVSLAWCRITSRTWVGSISCLSAHCYGLLAQDERKLFDDGFSWSLTC